MIAGVCALVCLMANLARLKNWYHHAIWQSPAVVTHHCIFGMTISLAMFVLYPIATQLNWFSSVNIHTLGLHGLAVFGIGLMTIAMMARCRLDILAEISISPLPLCH